ncbi:MAG: class I SAM-dependent methyltransferase [Ktedonobacteraceae bacterium]
MPHRMTNDEFYTYLVAEYNKPYVGWDMSYLKGRSIDLHTEPHWDYTATVLAAMRISETMLDMGTGGGERLAAFAAMQPLPSHVYATEGYVPNIAVTRQRLEPLGVTIVGIDDDYHLPFADEQFDLIINRHASYEPGEVLRILKPGHRFITQQVGDQTNRRLHELFGYEPKDTFYPGVEQKPAWNLDYAVRELQNAAWQIIEQEEEFFTTRYYDVGAIVYYLKAIPWEILDFSVEKYFDKLLEIAQLVERDGYVDVLFHQFFIVAQKA